MWELAILFIIVLLACLTSVRQWLPADNREVVYLCFVLRCLPQLYVFLRVSLFS